MRVGIDLTCWSNRRGYGRFTRGLVEALLEHDREHRYVLFFDAQTAGEGGLPERGETIVVPTHRAPTEAAGAASSRSLRDLWVMGRRVGYESLDVLFYPSVYTWFPCRTRASVVVGIHDVIAEDFPELVFPDPRRRRLWALKSFLARRRADYLLTVSEHARRGLLRHFRHPPEKIWVVEESADPVFRPLAPEELEPWPLAPPGPRPGDPYLVYLGGINPHKNLESLAHSLDELRRHPELADLRLVVVGAIEGDNFTPGLEMLRCEIAALGLEEVVVFTGYLTDEAVCRLLNAARALVLPSMAEGFGLPAVEAAACGVPVVATRNSPLPELLEGGGLFIGPASRGELTEALTRVLLEPGLRDRLAGKALEQASRLSWRHSAQQFLGLLAAIGEAPR